MHWFVMVVLSTLISWQSQNVNYRVDIERQRPNGRWQSVALQVADTGQYEDRRGRQRHCYRVRYVFPQTTDWSPVVCAR